MRKWKYVVMSLCLTGATATFTGCIDTDEPKGISELRTAKAELLKAQATLRLADAAVRNADAAYRLAEVEGQNMLNEWQALQNELVRLQVALESVNNEKEMADLQREIDEITNKREEIAEKHKATMLDLEAKTAQAQQTYDEAIKAIELAKLLLTESEQQTITDATDLMDKANEKLDKAYGAVYEAREKLNGVLITDANTNWDLRLKSALARAEYGLKAAEKGVEEIEALLEKDHKTTDAWEEEIEGLKETKLGLEVELSQAEADEKRLEIEHIADKANVDALEELYNDANEKEIELGDWKSNVITNTEVISILGTDQYEYTGGKFTNEEYIDDRGVAVNVLDSIQGWLDDIEKRGVVSAEDLAQAKVNQSRLQAALVAAQAAYTPDRTAWSAAVRDYTSDPDDTLFLSTLRSTSNNAFGAAATLATDQIRLTEPTAQEIMNLVAAPNGFNNYSDYGTFGEQVEASIAVADANAIVNAGADFIILADELQAQYDAVLKIATDNKNLVAAAKTAYETADAAYEDLFTEVRDIITGQQDIIDMYDGLISLLEDNIKKYLEHDSTGYANYEKFTAALEEALLDANDGVVDATAAVAKAEKEIELFEAGEYTEQYRINEAELALKLAIDKYDVAKAVYDDAYARVQEIISILLN